MKFPVEETATPINHAAGFVYSHGRVYPAAALNEMENGWAEFRIDYGGSSDSGVARPGNWAHEAELLDPCLHVEVKCSTTIRPLLADSLNSLIQWLSETDSVCVEEGVQISDWMDDLSLITRSLDEKKS